MEATTPTTDQRVTLSVEVPGLPIPQGSKRIGRHGTRAVILDDNDRKLRPWRRLVRMRCEHEKRGLDGFPIDGPAVLIVTFVMPRPKTMPRGRTEPSVKPDLSKLIRAVEDSITEALVWTDDSRVTSIGACKRYVEEGEEPHALIYVEAL